MDLDQVCRAVLLNGLESDAAGMWEALCEDDTWVPPAHGTSSLVFCTTDVGRDHYLGPQRGRWVDAS